MAQQTCVQTSPKPGSQTVCGVCGRGCVRNPTCGSVRGKQPNPTQGEPTNWGKQHIRTGSSNGTCVGRNTFKCREVKLNANTVRHTMEQWAFATARHGSSYSASVTANAQFIPAVRLGVLKQSPGSGKSESGGGGCGRGCGGSGTRCGAQRARAEEVGWGER